jgi:hypothetical protein
VFELMNSFLQFFYIYFCMSISNQESKGIVQLTEDLVITAAIVIDFNRRCVMPFATGSITHNHTTASHHITSTTFFLRAFRHVTRSSQQLSFVQVSSFLCNLPERRRLF